MLILITEDSPFLKRNNGSSLKRNAFSVDDTVLVWKPMRNRIDECDGIVFSWKEVVDYALKINQTYIVAIAANQEQLKYEIVHGATTRIYTEAPDYFTQWEHSSLPIGFGARFFSLHNVTIKNWEGTPDALLHYILSNPDNFSILYDDIYYEKYASLSECVSHNALSDLTPYCDQRGLPASLGFESRRVANFPGYIMFDITNKCNAACAHCPHAVCFEGKDDALENLSLKAFKAVIDECRHYPIDFIRITADGEPLLHPDIVEMIRYTKIKDMKKVGLTTNGALLNQSMAENLLNEDLFLVDISLDGYTEKTYKLIRRGLNYSEVTSNIHTFLELRQKMKKKTKVIVSFVLQEKNKNEELDFINYWQKYVDKVLIRKMTSNVNLVNGVSYEDPVSRWPCPHVFRRIVINYNREIKICPIDWENKTLISSLDNTSLYEIWHGKAYWEYRVQLLNNRFTKNILCKECRDWHQTPWQLGYEKVVKSLQ